MVLKLICRHETRIPVEIEGFTPDWARDKSRDEIERFSILRGNEALPLAELFSVSGDASDQEWVLEGDLSHVHWIGAQMRSGMIRIAGDAGRHVGSEMRGGTIQVEGNTDLWTGAEMHGGLIHVHGNAGHLAGAAYRGATKGMTAGQILIQGNAGDEVGTSMRRGLIAIGGTAGNVVGFRMIAGTILVLGDCGERPGAGMRRGTIGLFGSRPPQLLPSFQRASLFPSPMMNVILLSLRNQGFFIEDSLINAPLELHRGDFVALGRGEILTRVGAESE